LAVIGKDLKVKTVYDSASNLVKLLHYETTRKQEAREVMAAISLVCSRVRAS
jgi:hypothetical protein